MKISEIKDKGLRELAELRREQRDREYDDREFEEFSDELISAFYWPGTPEGRNIWDKVDDKQITTLEQLNKAKAEVKEEGEPDTFKLPTLEERVAELELKVVNLENNAVPTKEEESVSGCNQFLNAPIDKPEGPKQGDTVWVRDRNFQNWEKREYFGTKEGIQYPYAVCDDVGIASFKYMTTTNPFK